MNFYRAVQGCTYVIHVASPLPSYVPRDEQELIRPAVEGTRRVLQACTESGSVRRVVLTSSVAAVGNSDANGSVFSETDWSDPGSLRSYAKSKVLAERAAWDFVSGLSGILLQCFK